jgi:phage virion morphogenesis protein
MTASVRGLDESKVADEAMAERMGNLQPVLQVLAQDLKTLIDNSFDQSKSPMGQAWAPLKPATIKRRRKGSSKPLVDTARLRNSNTTQALPRAIRFGTNVEYAAAHQFGTERIPARAFLPITPTGQFAEAGAAGAFIDEMGEAIATYIETGALPR